MRTTIDLPDPLFRKVKSAAAERGLKLKEFIAQSLTSTINNEQGATAGSTVQEQHRKRVLEHIVAMKRNRIQSGPVGSFNRDELHDRHD
jgi:hypothetical protein